MLFRGCSDGSSPSTPPLQVARQFAPPTAPTKTTPPDPAKTLADSKATLREIESRLTENDKNLRKHYGTTDEIKEASSDLINGTYSSSVRKTSQQGRGSHSQSRSISH